MAGSSDGEGISCRSACENGNGKRKLVDLVVSKTVELVRDYCLCATFCKDQSKVRWCSFDELEMSIQKLKFHHVRATAHRFETSSC